MRFTIRYIWVSEINKGTSAVIRNSLLQNVFKSLKVKAITYLTKYNKYNLKIVLKCSLMWPSCQRCVPLSDS